MFVSKKKLQAALDRLSVAEARADYWESRFADMEGAACDCVEKLFAAEHRADATCAELDALKANRSETVSRGNRTRYAKRRAGQ